MRLVLMLSLAVAAAGCGSTSRKQWVSAQGGVVSDSRQARVERAAERISSSCGLCKSVLRPQVLDRSGPAAYSFKDGSVFVSRGLVDLLDDDELLAAVAHEAGHLINDKHMTGFAALRGAAVHGDGEHAADQAGCRVLAACGMQPSLMSRMLRKVALSENTPLSIRNAMLDRVTLLER
jgi:Zn-dependent protease with chaperone function